jgi:hypothetical protein
VRAETTLQQAELAPPQVIQLHQAGKPPAKFSGFQELSQTNTANRFTVLTRQSGSLFKTQQTSLLSKTP